MFARGLAFVLVVAAATFGAGSPAKATQLTQTVLSQCVSEVRAPGSFSLVEGPDDAVLVSATGASQASIANVNDCLADKQQIQYAALAFAGVSTEDGGATSVQECKRIRNEKLIVGVALTAGVVAALGATDGAIIGGVLGTFVGTRNVNREYKACVAQVNATTLTGLPKSFGGRCLGGKSVLQGGTGYCID